MANKTYAVRADEDPWTPEEVTSVITELEAEAARLDAELNESQDFMRGQLGADADDIGSDPADMGANALDRDSELSLAENQRDLMWQTRRALERIADGSYGLCELCNEPIGKMRLMAFSRATLCMSCKQNQERR